jgi:hypothetical protein
MERKGVANVGEWETRYIVTGPDSRKILPQRCITLICAAILEQTAVTFLIFQFRTLPHPSTISTACLPTSYTLLFGYAFLYYFLFLKNLQINFLYFFLQSNLLSSQIHPQSSFRSCNVRIGCTKLHPISNAKWKNCIKVHSCIFIYRQLLTSLQNLTRRKLFHPSFNIETLVAQNSRV